MNPSLCILLPVHNQQAVLAARVASVLDVAADLGVRFEILVVDDASTDATFETAGDLSRVYPQVSVLRNGRRLGTTLAVETGLRRTSADFVAVHDPTDSHFDASQLARLWKTATQSTADAFARMTARLRRGSGRRGFSHAMTTLVEEIGAERRTELASSFGGFRLCRPRLYDAAERRYEFDGAETQAVAQPIQSAARHRIGRIRHLLRQD